MKRLKTVFTKAVSFAAAAALTAGLASSASALTAPQPTKFADIKSGSWYVEAVNYVVENDIFAGTSASTFSPESPMTRGMFVQVLSNYCSNYNQNEDFGDNFTDAGKGTWYHKPINWAYENGLVYGTSETEFSPESPVTRQQAARMLHVYALRTGGKGSVTTGSFDGYSDAGKVAGYARAAMRWADENKVISGIGGNRLDPEGTLTRAQAAQLFMNIWGSIGLNPTVYPYGGTADDPDIEQLSIIGKTYKELLDMSKNPPKELNREEFPGGTIFTYEFDCYPGVAVHFDAFKVSDDFSTVLDDAEVTIVSMLVGIVLPQIEGKTIGEAVKITNGIFDVSFGWDDVLPSTKCICYYDTESFTLGIDIHDTNMIRGDDWVHFFSPFPKYLT